MLKNAIIYAAVGTLTVLANNAVQAREYPWCAYYNMYGGAENCGFSTRAQCRAAIAGVGGICQTNPRYQPPVSRSGRRSSR